MAPCSLASMVASANKSLSEGFRRLEVGLGGARRRRVHRSCFAAIPISMVPLWLPHWHQLALALSFILLSQNQPHILLEGPATAGCNVLGLGSSSMGLLLVSRSYQNLISSLWFPGLRVVALPAAITSVFPLAFLQYLCDYILSVKIPHVAFVFWLDMNSHMTF